jgi:peptidoglycan/xylan/chitin deacetylase (PgdA/CDA1 family)
MTAKSPKRGAILGYVINIIIMTLGIVLVPVVTAPAAAIASASSCQPPAAGAIYRTPGPNQVALTIDDGPSGNWTPQVLSILQSHGVHATFFVIGENVRANPGLIRQILAGGNRIGNHTDTHPTLTGMSAAAQGQQMDADTQAIVNAGGPEPCFFRAPGGGFDPNTLAQARQRGMSLVQWSNDTLDWTAPPYRDGNFQNQVINLATNPLYTNPIILMHDGSPGNYRQNSVDSLARVIEFYQARGYQFTDPAGQGFQDNPVGYLDSLTGGVGTFHVSGWVFDPNSPYSPINLAILVDRSYWFPSNTGLARPDVHAVYPYAGEMQGFDSTFEVSGGWHQVIVFAKNIGPGGDSVMGVRDIFVSSHSPTGSLEVAAEAEPGSLRIAGWAFDADSPGTAVDLAVLIDGAYWFPARTGVYRPDVPYYYPYSGYYQGYDAEFVVGGGVHHVVVFGQNIGDGGTAVFGVRDVWVSDPNPTGFLDMADGVAPGVLHIVGWAFDPNSPTSPIDLAILVDRTYWFPATTGVSRPDVHAVFPYAGTRQGYDASFVIGSGWHNVIVFAKNIGFGGDSVFGVRDILVP